MMACIEQDDIYQSILSFLGKRERAHYAQFLDLCGETLALDITYPDTLEN